MIAGILMGSYAGNSIYTYFIAVCLSLLLAALSFTRFVSKAKELPPFIRLNSAIIYSAFFVIGMVLVFFNNDLNQSSHYSKFNSSYYGTYEIQIADVPDEKKKGYLLEADVVAVKSDDSYFKSSGKIQVFIEKSEESNNIKYGDRLLVRAPLQEVKSKSNPGSFDYAHYLQSKQIYHTAYVDSSSWKMTLSQQGSILKAYAIHSRNKALSFLERNKMFPREMAVASALFLGDKSLLDYRQSEIYSTAGAMHVLAVSGLHVGVVLLLLQFILKPIKRIRWVYLLLLLVGIWSFALLTGFSSSVIRAATMFSLVGIGQTLYRNQNIYHTIAFSAFILLLIDPYLIFDVGFQLSYLAVLGIVYLQPKIYNWFYFKSSVLDKIWKLTSVSIAAQVATFPVAAYYFHLFPTYFFITNLIVIPLTVAILYVGVIILIFSWVDPLVYYLVQILNGIIWLMNEAVAFIEQLPYARWGEIRFTLPDVFLLFIALFLFLGGFEYRKKYILKWALSFFTLFWISRLGYDIYRGQQKEWMLLNQKKNSALVFTDGHNAKWFFQKENKKETEILKTGLSTEMGIIDHDFNRLVSNRYSFNGEDILIYKEKMKNQLTQLDADFILLTNNTFIPYAEIHNIDKESIFLVDGSCSYYYRKRLKRVLKQLGYKYYDTAESGAYIRSL